MSLNFDSSNCIFSFKCIIILEVIVVLFMGEWATVGSGYHLHFSLPKCLLSISYVPRVVPPAIEQANNCILMELEHSACLSYKQY